MVGELTASPAVYRTASVRADNGPVFQDATRSLNPVLKVRTQLREIPSDTAPSCRSESSMP